ncbi:MAG: 2-oxoglutarate ferredoxin oxidoreductase, alpha subunit [candidate division CPR2 bacterium GW2011_GWC1_41_48]|uniref:2-oxoglutarate ferredoxin oxidoreductase, alpha subunit n=1 Tax=candidate division CPR2 bacterium GW2011_GWC1_41_48 TaxID=1618344 RepID=A0A0G0WAN2_UNCC2|nr:MAG: 2-oxoglutarate ferredoxin oxidoreductase, alpha subunit [candidate division CPR2 bacterium GW2011_GWC2_39_35]KKS09102.1 MAG: 2-oxoglutarate ferredoxin oxidoreductase, alpha subunit [candidate division CPR2 bacterium GW2011_GWC1_41_48]
MNKVLAIGNEVVVEAAIDAGASMFCGYPITPSTEILAGWAKRADVDKDLVFLQTEDEIAAGFATIGGILAGKKAWTASAGPGNILMQDSLAMAEAMRIPIVTYIAQRGGPSTGTVIFSQQELFLTAHGGNGEGMRIVYSPGNLQELYDYTFKAFDAAWRYRFPTFILSDGYLGKTFGEVIYHKGKTIDAKPMLQDKERIEKGEYVNIRNCYSLEDELAEVLNKDIEDFHKMSPKIVEYEELYCGDAELIVFAHGSVAEAVKAAVSMAREQKMKVGLFRPITLRPLPKEAMIKAVRKAKKIMVIEAAHGQFAKLVRDALFGATQAEYYSYFKPAEGIVPEEALEKIQEVL